MSKLEELEQKALDTKAAYSDAYAAYASADTKGSLAADTKAAEIAYAAYTACVDAAGAHLQAMDELEEYKEQANEF